VYAADSEWERIDGLMKKLLNRLLTIVLAATVSALCAVNTVHAADSASAPPPETLEAAVSAVIARMNSSQKSIVKGTAKDSLFLLLGEWGDDIEERLLLKNKNNKLATTVCKKTCSSEEATLIIMKAAWDELQK
jgi:hypothetical protein